MIQSADPGARRRAIILACATILLAVAAYVVADRWLADAAARSTAEARAAIAAVLRWGTAAVATMAAASGLYLFLLGRRVVSGRRFPPAGMAVIKDTRVIEGRSARTRGFIIQALALTLMAAATALPFAAFKVAALIESASALNPRLEHTQPAAASRPPEQLDRR
jgi:hypothetical protein